MPENQVARVTSRKSRKDAGRHAKPEVRIRTFGMCDIRVYSRENLAPWGKCCGETQQTKKHNLKKNEESVEAATSVFINEKTRRAGIHQEVKYKKSK